MSNNSEEAAIMRMEREATGPARHILKTWPEPFAAVAAGRKTHEFRRNDRDYQVGDMLVLRFFDPAESPPGPTATTIGELIRWVTYISHGPAFGIPDGYCVMSISARRPGTEDAP